MVVVVTETVKLAAEVVEEEEAEVEIPTKTLFRQHLLNPYAETN